MPFTAFIVLLPPDLHQAFPQSLLRHRPSTFKSSVSFLIDFLFQSLGLISPYIPPGLDKVSPLSRPFSSRKLRNKQPLTCSISPKIPISRDISVSTWKGFFSFPHHCCCQREESSCREKINHLIYKWEERCRGQFSSPVPVLGREPQTKGSQLTATSLPWEIQGPSQSYRV